MKVLRLRLVNYFLSSSTQPALLPLLKPIYCSKLTLLRMRYGRHLTQL